MMERMFATSKQAFGSHRCGTRKIYVARLFYLLQPGVASLFSMMKPYVAIPQAVLLVRCLRFWYGKSLSSIENILHTSRYSAYFLESAKVLFALLCKMSKCKDRNVVLRGYHVEMETMSPITWCQVVWQLRGVMRFRNLWYLHHVEVSQLETGGKIRESYMILCK